MLNTWMERDIGALVAEQTAVSAETLEQARTLVDAVRHEGMPALRRLAERFGDVEPDAPVLLGRSELLAALERIPASDRRVLGAAAERIRSFADAQRAAIVDVDVPVPGGRAGHRVEPVARAGCYAPGGRFPLPSSVLMTVVTARAAGVPEVVVASPRPTDITLAAAAMAGADRFLAVGGAQAIGALAFGVEGLPAVDVVVGPGNRWVTAAKQLVSGRVRIDMLAGPSELVVLADDTADPEVVAADLLAQAEHDTDAIPVLVTPSERLAMATGGALEAQLATLSTAETARVALANGGWVRVDDVDAGVAVCDAMAPEHLQIQTADARAVAGRCRRYGGLFVGSGSAEVYGDYGIGPNHTLPTGGTARYTGGLSVFSFLAIRTWLDVAPPRSIIEETARLAVLEGLAGHAAAARIRLE